MKTLTLPEVMKFNLNNTKMNVITTSPSGVVNQDTIFKFTQTNDLVCADYAGGKIEKGFLVGRRNGEQLTFSYCQLQLDGTLDNGISDCRLSINEHGKLQLIEHFEWKSRPGEKGVNIFQEL